MGWGFCTCAHTLGDTKVESRYPFNIGLELPVTCHDLKVHFSHQYTSFKIESIDLNFLLEMYLPFCTDWVSRVWFCREVLNVEMHPPQEDTHQKSALYQRLNYQKKRASFCPS